MKSWIIGLLLLGIAIPLIKSQDAKNNEEDDYEVKRFHVQSRQLNGRSTCVLSRRKRSNRQLGYNGDESFAGPQTSSEEENDEGSDQDMQIGVSTGDGNQESSGLLIRDSDLAGNAGVLVIQNGLPPNTPFLFELRPVVTDTKETFFEIDDENNPDAPDYVEDSEEVDENNNRFKPNSDPDSSSDEYEDISPPKRRARPTRRPQRKPSATTNSNKDPMRPNKKPKRPTSRPSRKPSRRKTQNKTKRGNKKNRRRKGNRNGASSSLRRKQSNQAKRRLKNRFNSSLNKNQRLGVQVNKGSGSKTVTNTVTTTQTGTANDIPDVNCIVINKSTPSSTTEKPFWGLLGRTTGDKEEGRDEDRSFGLRKRLKQKFSV